MDARERAEILGSSARAERDRAMWTGDKLTPTDEYYRRIAIAAVRAAYEIDGVEALVMAAEDSLIMYHDADEYDNAQERLRAAAARVREAMGGGA